MASESNIQKLRVARDKLADVYQDEVTTEGFDNGLLDVINSAIKSTENGIQRLTNKE